MEPVQIKAACHPHLAVTAAIRTGAMKAEAFDPELKRPSGQGALFRGEPLGGGFDGGGGKLPDSRRGRGRRGRCRNPGDAGDEEWLMEAHPHDEDGEGVALFGAELVDNAAGEEETYSVSDLEEDEDAAEVDVVGGPPMVGVVETGDPTHEGKMEQGLDEREDRAVHVVDGGRKEEEEADEPADVGLEQDAEVKPASRRLLTGLDGHSGELRVAGPVWSLNNLRAKW